MNEKEIAALLFRAAPHSKPARKSAKVQVREARSAILREAIFRIRRAARERPVEWQRGYSSAITQVEMLLSEIE